VRDALFDRVSCRSAKVCPEARANRVESLADVALGIHRLDLCSMFMTQKFLTDFLRTNRSIRILGFHNVEVSHKGYRAGVSLHPHSIDIIIDV
jgi:hypothetical protein